MRICFLFIPVLMALTAGTARPAAYRNVYGQLPVNATLGDRLFADCFREETRAIAARTLSVIHTLEDWSSRKAALRHELFEMLGMDPLPPKTDLRATIVGTIDQPDFAVERLHFQSRPGLYVTANLYRPKGLTRPAPAILYVCGHSPVKSNGVSYGNKVAYQHHGIWFARNGYVCLVLDTIEAGEIEGHHHGTYRDGMWWWNSRGYSSAAAEAWNCIRALDYLETRTEVDPRRLGVTGRSGGGAYSWWIAALDDRIQAACPVAGITDLENHVIDGTVEGHCDCMFMVNTYRWDYAQVAALVAPRPLLICNTDKDTIFPLDGVSRVHEKVRRIYDLHGASDHLGLLITEGPHHDTQDLQVPVLRWFNRFLKQQDPLVQNAAVKLFRPEQLKVFDQLPADEITSTCHESFTRLAQDDATFEVKDAIGELRKKTFGGWPTPSPLNLRQVASAEQQGVRFSVHEFVSQPGLALRLYLARPAGAMPKELRLSAVGESDWRRELGLWREGFAAALKDEIARADWSKQNAPAPEAHERFVHWMASIRAGSMALITFAPRGIGLSALSDDPGYQTQIRRRFMLLGQTLAGMQVWDVCRAVRAARIVAGTDGTSLRLVASPELTEIAAFVTAFEPGIANLTLTQAPRADQEAPDFLNWSRIVTPRQLLRVAQEQCQVTIAR